MKILGSYKNGNYITTIYDDGTKIRETEECDLVPDFAESMDIKICNRCDMGCAQCHEDSTPNGKLGDIMNEKFIETLHPFTEVAIGGGNPLEHPDLIPFLRKLKSRRVIPSMTVNQVHFEKNIKQIDELVREKLIYGLGVSLMEMNDGFIEKIKKYPNAVIHVINGIVSPTEIEELAKHNIKMLILGYKQVRRGVILYEKDSRTIIEKQEWLYKHLWEYVGKFRVVSFDNLAVEQLNMRRFFTDEEWEEFYMGDDSEFTYFIDMVERKFAKSSTAPLNERYDLLDDVDEMFAKIRKGRRVLKIITNESQDWVILKQDQ